MWTSEIKCWKPRLCLFGRVLGETHAVLSCDDAGLVFGSDWVQQRWIFLLGFITLIVIQLSNLCF